MSHHQLWPRWDGVSCRWCHLVLWCRNTLSHHPHLLWNGSLQTVWVRNSSAQWRYSGAFLLHVCYCSNFCYQFQTRRDVQKITIILIFCYIIFILPIYVVEWIPSYVNYGPKISVIMCTWYWLIYIINVFVYIIYSERARECIGFFLRDIAGIFNKRDENNSDTDLAWIEHFHVHTLSWIQTLMTPNDPHMPS